MPSKQARRLPCLGQKFQLGNELMVNNEVTSPLSYPAPPFPVFLRGKAPLCHKAELATTRASSPW